MESFRTVIGHRDDAELRDLLSEQHHRSQVVYLRVPAKELGRRRFRVLDQHGVEYGVALPRDVELRDGSVLEISERRAVVVHALESERLLLRATSAAGGIQLGWHAGHLHWRVRASDDQLTVLLDGPRDEYLRRIAQHIGAGIVEVEE